MTFLRSYGGDGFTAAGLQGTGTGRMAGLAETYVDLPPGIAGAAMAAIAECLGLTGIATLDHRHFGVIRPRHVQAFTLLPGPGRALSVSSEPAQITQIRRSGAVAVGRARTPAAGG